MKKIIPKKSIIIAILIFIALGAIITYAATGGGWLFKSVEAKGLVANLPLDNVNEIVGSELASNTGFESFTGTVDDGLADDFASWSENNGDGTNGSTIEAVTTKNNGSYAMKITTGTVRPWAWVSFTVTANKLYKFSFYTRGDGTRGGGYAIYDQTNAAWVVSATELNITGTTYTKFTTYAQAPAGSTTMRLYLYGTAYTGNNCFFDDVSVSQVTGAQDKTPNGNNGTLFGTTFTTDRDGQTNRATSFDGSNDYINMPTGMIAYNSNATFSTWFKTASSTNAAGVIGNDINSGINFSYNVCGGIVYMNSNIMGTVYSANNYQTISQVVSLNQWYHVVFVRDITNSQIKLYVNGALVNTVAFTPASLGVVSAVQYCDTNYFKIGRHSSSNTSGPYQYLSADLSDARVYNRALSAGEVSQLYSSYRPSTHASSQDKGLVGHWPLDSISESTATEKILNNTFSDTSAWVLAGGSTPITVQNGEAVLASATNIYQAVSTTSGKRYKIKFDVHGTGGNYLGFHVASDYWSNNQIQYLGNTRYTATTTVDTYFTATADRTYIYFREENGTGGTLYLDNIYLREVKANDTTSNMSHGTVYGAAYAADQNGQANRAMSFNGTSDYIELPTHNDFNSQTITYSAWIKSTSYVANYMPILIYKGGTRIGYHFMGCSSQGKISFWVGGGGASWIATTCGNTVLTDNTWYHVVATWDGYSAKVYVNGVLDGEGTGSGTVTFTGSVSSIGKGYYGTAVYFPGSMADVRVYNRALSAAEINTLYGSYRPKASYGSLIKGLIGEWTMKSKNLRSATSMADITPYVNHGTLNGTTVGADSTVFNGTSDYVDLGTNSSLTMPDQTAWTYSIWANVTGNPMWDYLVSNNAAWNNSNMILHWNTVLYFYDVNSTSHTLDIGSLADAWHLITVTMDASRNCKIYKDGVLMGAPANAFANSTMGFRYIGAIPANNYFGGSLADMRIYNRELSATEIKLLYDKGR